MKAKRIVPVMIGMLLLAVIAIAAEQNKGAKDIQLSGGDKGKIAFPHQKHQEVIGDCKICHDAFPQETGSIGKLQAEGKLEKKQIMNKQCIKCHKEKEKAGVKTGPTACSKCHQK
jgi:c(7)-type cytochrome triheme protein